MRKLPVELHPRAAVASMLLSIALGTSAQGTGKGTAPDTGTSTGARTSSASVAPADREFVEKAAAGGMAEVHLGQMAQQNASSPQVKQFGARMVSDHGKANDELKQIAGAKGMQLPGTLDNKHMQDMQKLQSMKGADFDREYMKHMIADHKKDIAEFQKQAKSGKDADLKDFAARKLPTLQEHLKLAQGVNESLGAGNKAVAPKAPS
jgi:putative membrane protein